MTTIPEITRTMQGKMDQSIAAFKQTMVKIRTGRPSPGLLDTVHVDYYGSSVPISQVANVSVLDNRTLSVQPWENSMAAKIEKAIRDSDLGRRDANEHVKRLVKDKHASEDDLKRSEAEIQKITDRHVAEIDQLVHAKEQEIMAV